MPITSITKKSIPEDRTTLTGSFGITPPAKSEPFENNTLSGGVSHRLAIGEIASLNVYGEYWKNDGFLRNNWAKRGTFGGDFSLFLPLDIKAKIGTRWSIHDRGFAIKNEPGTVGYNPDKPTSLEDAGGGPGIAWAAGKYFGDRSYWHNIRSQHDLTLEKSFESIHIAAQLWLQDQDRWEYFYDQFDSSNLILERFAKPEALTGGWNLKAKQSIGEQVSLNYGTEMIWGRNEGALYYSIDSSFFAKVPASPLTTDATTTYIRNSLFLQGKIEFWDKRVGIDLGVRGDRQKDYKSEDTLSKEDILTGISPNISLLLSFWNGGTVSLTGAYVNRFPTQPEFYWYYNGYAPEGRPDLTPEKALQGEAGLMQEFGSIGSLALRGYRYAVNDYLVTIFGYKPSRVIYNIDKVYLSGLECEGSIKPLKPLTLWGNITYMGSEKVGDFLDKSNTLTDELPEMPKVKGNIGVQVQSKKNSTVGVTVRMMGKQNALLGNFAMEGGSSLVTVDGFTTVGLNGSYQIVNNDLAKVTVRMAIENLFDVEYAERYGFPMPGISALLGLTAEF